MSTDIRAGPLPECPLRILVVDDDCDSADILGELLDLWGHTARVAYEAAVALEAARASLPDVMLIDLAMPRADGTSLARQVRGDAALHGIVLVALTGFSDELHREMAREAGFDHFLTKPFEPERLRSFLLSLPHALTLAGS